MVGRLANVLYWLGCGIAGLFFALALASAYFLTPPDATLSWFLLASSLVSWLVGRAIRYVLAGN